MPVSWQMAPESSAAISMFEKMMLRACDAWVSGFSARPVALMAARTSGGRLVEVWVISSTRLFCRKCMESTIVAVSSGHAGPDTDDGRAVRRPSRRGGAEVGTAGRRADRSVERHPRTQPHIDAAFKLAPYFRCPAKTWCGPAGNRLGGRRQHAPAPGLGILLRGNVANCRRETRPGSPNARYRGRDYLAVRDRDN